MGKDGICGYEENREDPNVWKLDWHHAPHAWIKELR